jgi:hypothetical protein
MIRKSTLLIFAVCSSISVLAQCDQIFISEYIEGSNNNKALELYNPTDKAIDLKDYRLTRWSNGSFAWSPQYSDKLSGTIEPLSTFNLVIDRTDIGASGQDTAASAELLNKADLLLSKDYNISFSMSFNGDDALSLDIIDPNPSDPTNPYLPIDIFGKIGERPRLGGSTRTIGWSDSFPYNTGLGLWCTINKTLIRKKSIVSGVTANPDFFNPREEWEVFPINTFDSFGTHVCDCETLGSTKVKKTTLNLFPNPALNATFIPFHGQLASLEVIALNGKTVTINYKENNFARMHGYTLDLSNLSKGQYIIAITGTNGLIHSARLLKE